MTNVTSEVLMKDGTVGIINLQMASSSKFPLASGPLKQEIAVHVPPPSSYLSTLRISPSRPLPSLASISQAITNLRVLYVDNNHDEGHDLNVDIEELTGPVSEVEEAWQEALSLVRADDFEKSYSTGWLTRFISLGDEFIEGREDGDEWDGEDEGVSDAESESGLEERRQREKLVDDAAAILAVCSGTSASGELERTFRLIYRSPLPPINLSSSPADHAATQAFSITIRDGSILQHDGVGVQTWGSSVLLARSIASDPSAYGLCRPSHLDPLVTMDRDGKKRDPRLRVLELGSGTGLVGMAVAKVLKLVRSENEDQGGGGPADEVVLTDFHDAVLDNLKNNVIVNQKDWSGETAGGGGGVDVGVAKLDWKVVHDEVVRDRDVEGAETDAEEDADEDRFDLIVGADIIYEPAHARWIKSCVEKYLKKPEKISETPSDPTTRPLDSGYASPLLAPQDQIRTQPAPTSLSLLHRERLLNRMRSRSPPTFHLLIPCRPTHGREVATLREVFGDAPPSSARSTLQEVRGRPLEIGMLSIDEFERKDKTVGRADEMGYMHCRIGWRETR